MMAILSRMKSMPAIVVHCTAASMNSAANKTATGVDVKRTREAYAGPRFAISQKYSIIPIAEDKIPITTRAKRLSGVGLICAGFSKMITSGNPKIAAIAIMPVTVTAGDTSFRYFEYKW